MDVPMAFAMLIQSMEITMMLLRLVGIVRINATKGTIMVMHVRASSSRSTTMVTKFADSTLEIWKLELVSRMDIRLVQSVSVVTSSLRTASSAIQK
jgi:hypothetical protein